VTGTGLLKDAAEEKGPIPPWSPRPRNAHEGFWNGLNPAGYKLVRRVLHRAPPWKPSETEEPALQRCSMGNTIVARLALSPSTPRA
jgi:hypothetical protein